MKADKRSNESGTICITDRQHGVPAVRPERALQSHSRPYVMSHASPKNEMLNIAPNSPDLPSADGALETLRASQKLIHLGRMAASIAHEVNNPLESITNLLYLIRREAGLSQDALAYLDMAEREMERVVTISKQTLNFAREANEPVEVSLPSLLEEVLVLYRRRIDEKQLRIAQRYTPTEALCILPGEMRQVLSNLIVNAIEACSQRGAVTLRVRPASTARGTNGIRITIADNGPGIPPTVRQHLGKLFFSTKGQGGTGLGLWVTRSIIEQYGGQLRLRSAHISEPHGKTRHGTVFVLFLPLRAKVRPQSGGGSGTGPVLVARAAKMKGERFSSSMRLTANES